MATISTDSAISAVPSVHREGIVENFSAFDFELSPDDMAAIATPDTGASLLIDHRDPQVAKWMGGAKLNA